MAFGCSSFTGKTLAVEMTAVGDTCFNYFQDFNPCRKSSAFPQLQILQHTDPSFLAIGLYVNVSD